MPHLADILDVMEREPLEIDGLDFGNVTSVFFAEDNVGDAGTLGSEYLLLDAAHGQHLAAQRYLARHGQIGTHLALGECRSQSRCHGDACRGAVFGNGAFGYMEVYVPMVEHLGIDMERSSMSLQVLKGNGGTLLHDVTQIAGEGQLPLATRETGFDEEDFASHGRPRQSCHHPGIAVALIAVAGVFLYAQQFRNLLHADVGVVEGALLGKLQGQLTANLANLLVQFTDARFAGIVLDYLLQGGLKNVDAHMDAVLLHLLTHQVTAGNLHLLFGEVAAHLDEFHTVEQRGRNGADVVRRGNEHDVREVEIDVKEIIVEGIVLLRVEHLKQSARGVAVVRHLGDFVNLVEDEDRV